MMEKIYLKVAVFPDFKKELVEQVSENNFKMYIREPAERGLANKKVLKILGEFFPNRKIKIVTGQKSAKKLIEIG